MDLSWVNLTNPVSLWWLFLISVSLINIVAWSWTKIYLYKNHPLKKFKSLSLSADNIIWFSAFYVFGCAYRSVFVKADVQRMCLFDSWLSSVFLGRTVATVAELCFVAQWAIVIRIVATLVHMPEVKKISYWIIPIIAIAEIFSWYAVISTNYFGNMIEESLWTLTYTLIAYALIKLRSKFKGAFKYALNIAIIFDLIYVSFMIFVDVTMYFNRWRMDLATNKKYFSFIDGLIDLNTRWIVTYDILDWKTEIPWMSLYFSFAVLVSIGLCYVPLNKERIKKHLF